MSSIEERLARDIAAITGGVVVTESDLRDARAAVDERIDSRRRRDRRLVVLAAAAVLIPVLGVAAFQTLGGEDKTSPPPTNPAPTSLAPTEAVDEHADFLTGTAPTPALVQGVWRVDNGTVLMRFSLPNLVSFDEVGQLFHDPGTHGTYAIEGDLITVNVDGGPEGCGGQTFAMRASLAKRGELHIVHTRPGTGNCSQVPDEQWVLEHVLPMDNKGLASLVLSNEKEGWKPVAKRSSMFGDWMAERGGHVLELDRDGSYYMADDSGEVVDRGQWSLQSAQLTLTSSAASSQCAEGDRFVLSELERVNPGTAATRGTVTQNTCGAAWTPVAWILLPNEAV